MAGTAGATDSPTLKGIRAEYDAIPDPVKSGQTPIKSNDTTRRTNLILQSATSGKKREENGSPSEQSSAPESVPEEEPEYDPGQDEYFVAPVPLSEHYWDNVRTTYFQIWPLLVGNLLEWYEFGIFAYVEPQITENFFPNEAVTWLVFSISLVTRPLGGIIAGKLSDTLGRKTILVLAMWGMTLTTVGQGLLPSAKTGGVFGLSVGMPLMIILRVIQGLAAGAGIGGISTYLSEHAKRQNLGITVSWIHMSSNFANAFAGGMVIMLNLLLSDEDMDYFGWRLPFLVSALPAGWLLANIDRLHEEDESKHLMEDEESKHLVGEEEAGAKQQDEKELLKECTTLEDSSFGSAWENTKKDYLKAKAALFEMDPDGPWNTIKRNKTRIFMLIFALAPKVAVRYMAPIYGPTYIDDEGGEKSVGLAASVLSQFIVFLLALPVGWLTDLFGVGRVLIVNNILALALGFPVFYLLGIYAETTWVVVLLLGVVFGLLQSLVSTSYLYVAEMFMKSERGAATGFAYNTASALWGGLGPFYATMLKGFIPKFPAWYTLLAGLVGFVAIFWNRYQHFAGNIRQVFIRAVPY